MPQQFYVLTPENKTKLITIKSDNTDEKVIKSELDGIFKQLGISPVRVKYKKPGVEYPAAAADIWSSSPQVPAIQQPAPTPGEAWSAGFEQRMQQPVAMPPYAPVVSNPPPPAAQPKSVPGMSVPYGGGMTAYSFGRPQNTATVLNEEELKQQEREKQLDEEWAAQQQLLKQQQDAWLKQQEEEKEAKELQKKLAGYKKQGIITKEGENVLNYVSEYLDKRGLESRSKWQPQEQQTAAETESISDLPPEAQALHSYKNYAREFEAAAKADEEARRRKIEETMSEKFPQRFNLHGKPVPKNRDDLARESKYRRYLEKKYAATLSDGRQKATPEQYATWNAGRKNFTGGELWFPEEKELKDLSFWQKAGQVLNIPTYDFTKSAREAVGLEDPDTSPYRRMAQTTENYATEDRKKELHDKKDRNEELSQEEKEWLAENDKGFFKGLWEGVTSLDDLAKMLATDPVERREFFNDMFAQLPASMATSKGIGLVAKGAKTAYKAGKTGMYAKANNLDFSKLNEARKLREALLKHYTENPAAFKEILKGMAIDQFADAFTESVVEAGMGGDLTPESIGRNLGEGFMLDGSVQSAIGVGGKLLKKAETGGKYMTKDQFNKTVGKSYNGFDDLVLGKRAEAGNMVPGYEGNLVLDHGMETGDPYITKGLQELASHPNTVEIMTEAAARRDKDATKDEKVKVYKDPNIDYWSKKRLEEAGYDSSVEQEGYKETRGTHKDGIAHIYGTGEGNTVFHESLHGLEKRMYAPNAPEELKQLSNDLANWVAKAQQWAEENGKPIPSEKELVSQTFTYRLGYDEPQAAAVKDIPVPDYLVSKMAEALGEGKNGKILRGEKDKDFESGSEQYWSNIVSKKERYKKQFNPDYEEAMPFSLAAQGKNAPTTEDVSHGTDVNEDFADGKRPIHSLAQEEKAKEYQNGTDRHNAVKRLAELIKSNNNEPLIVKSKDGEEARLSKNSIGKLVSNNATEKSVANGFTKEQHFAAAADIDNLFANSTKVLSRPDRSGDPNVKAIHRFAAPLFGDNAAYITVKEATEHGKRIYTVELIEMGKLEGKLNEDTSSITALGIASNPATNSPIKGNIQKSNENLDKKTLIKKLWKNARIQEAATGTIYAELDGKKIRIGDHEPNYGSPRSHDYTEIYTVDIEKKPLNWLSRLAEKWGETEEYESYRQHEFDEWLDNERELAPIRERNAKEMEAAEAEEERKIKLAKTAMPEWVAETERLANEAGEGKIGDKRKKAVRKVWNMRTADLLGEPLTRYYFFNNANEPRFKYSIAPEKSLPSMEEARAGVSENAKSRLGKIWDAAKRMFNNARKSETSPPASNKSISIGRTSENLNKAISEALGTEINTKNQTITLRQVSHISNKHGLGNEKFADQIPVTKETFTLIPDVLENFDTVEKGKDTWIGNERKNSVLISKHYSDGSIVLADAIVNDDVLEIKTIVVKKPTEVRPSSAKTPSGSLLSPSPADLTAPSEPALAKSGTQSATRNIQNSPEGDARYSLAWHGSPHDFDKFSLNHIGTGEGAQAYGHGLYFTDKKGIAKAYAGNRMGTSSFKKNNPDLAGKPFANYIARMVFNEGIDNKNDLIDFLSYDLKDLNKLLRNEDVTFDNAAAEASEGDLKKRISLLEQAIDYANNNDIKFREGGNLYKTNIYGDKPVSELNFMRWDKPLTEEHRQAVLNQVENTNARYNFYSNGEKERLRNSFESGRDLYKLLSKEFNSDLKASSFLLEAGINGIQYPAEYQSKGTHENAYNYVVFDDKALSIAEKIPASDIRYSLSNAGRAEAKNSPEYQIWSMAKQFLSEYGAFGKVENAFSKYTKMKSENNKKRKAGLPHRKIDDVDLLAQRISEDPDLAHLIGDDIDAGYKAIEIASQYERLTDSEKMEKGRAAQSGDNRSAEDLDYERREFENSEMGRIWINEGFNHELERFTPENADATVFNLGMPSEILLSAGIESKPIKFYGSKLLAKMKKHGFNASDLKDLPNAVNDPIAIFEGNRPDSFAVLTELNIGGNNVLAILEVGEGRDINFNLITSTYGKAKEGIANWVNDGKLLYLNKEKTPDYLGTPAPIAGAVNNQGSELLNNPRHPEDVNSNSTSKYNKFSEKKEDLGEENEKKAENPPVPPKKEDKPQGEAPEAGNWSSKLEAQQRGRNILQKKFDDLLSYDQDRFRNAKILNDFLPNKDHNFYRDIELMPGKIDSVADEYLKPFIDKIKNIVAKRELPVKEVNEYLYALHALDANKKAPSGMSDADAKAVLEKFKEMPASRKAAFETIAELNRKMNEWAYEYAVDSGLWSREAVNEWKKMYPNYVPLKGLETPELERLMGFSTASGVAKGLQPSQGVKARKGRETMAQDVLAQNFADKMALIANAERNKAMQTLHKMVKANPDPDFWQIDPQHTDSKGRYDSHQSEHVNTVPVFVDGEKHVIKFYSQFGMDLADYIKGAAEEFNSPVYRFISRWNRRLKSMYTSNNPEFTPFNFIRDVPFAAFTTFSDYGLKTAVKTMSKIPLILPSLLADDAKLKNKWSETRKDFIAHGGRTGFTQVLKFRQMAEKFENELKDVRRSRINPFNGAIPKNFNTLLHIIEAINSSIEDVSRIALYDTLVKEGRSKDEAAHAGKNVTLNFNRKGSNKWADQLFLFHNPAVQGIHALGSRLFSKDPAVRARAWIAAGFAFGVGITLRIYNESMADKDENGRTDYDNMPDYIKNSNLVIFTGNGRAITVPLSYELRPFFNAGRLLMDLSLNEKFSTMDFVAGTFNSLAESYNPLGSDVDPQDLAGSILKLASPYFIQPISDVGMNRAFTGKSIVPDSPAYLGYKQPYAHRYREGVNPYIKDLAIWLNDITYKDRDRYSSEFHSGDVDWSPEQMEHIFNGYMAGIASISGRMLGMKGSYEKGEEIQPRQIPIYRKIAYKASPSADRGVSKQQKQFTGAVTAELNSLKEKAKAAKGDAKKELAQKYKQFYEDNYGYIIFDTQYKKLKAPESNIRKQEEATESKYKGKGAKTMFDELASKIVKAHDQIEKLQDEHYQTDDPEKKKQLRKNMEKAAKEMTEGFLKADQ